MPLLWKNQHDWITATTSSEKKRLSWRMTKISRWRQMKKELLLKTNEATFTSLFHCLRYGGPVVYEPRGSRYQSPSYVIWSMACSTLKTSQGLNPGITFASRYLYMRSRSHSKTCMPLRRLRNKFHQEKPTQAEHKIYISWSYCRLIQKRMHCM